MKRSATGVAASIALHKIADCESLSDFLLNNISWAALDLGVDFSYVFPNRAQGQENRTSDKPERNCQARPSGKRLPLKINNQTINDSQQRKQQKQPAEINNKPKWLDRKGRDAVERKAHHLAEGVFRLSGLTRAAVIID